MTTRFCTCLLGVMLCATTTPAQPVGQSRTNAPRHEATPDRVAILKADRSVLEVPGAIERVALYLDGVSATQLVENGAGIDDVGVDIKSTALANALVERQARFIERVFNGPFSTQVQRDDGEVVDVPDLSIHYRIAFPSTEARDAFVSDMEGKQGILAVHREYTAEDYHQR